MMQWYSPKIVFQQSAARNFLHHLCCFPSGLLETGLTPHSSSSSLKAGSFQHQVFSKQGKKKKQLTGSCWVSWSYFGPFATCPHFVDISLSTECFFEAQVEATLSNFGQQILIKYARFVKQGTDKKHISSKVSASSLAMKAFNVK